MESIEPLQEREKNNSQPLDPHVQYPLALFKLPFHSLSHEQKEMEFDQG